MVGLGVEFVFVDAQHNGDIGVFRRGGNDDLLGTGRKVLACSFPIGKPSGRLKDDLDVQLFPRQLLRILHRQHFDRLSVDQDLIVFCFDAPLEGAVHRVVLQQIGQCLGVGQIIDGDELQLRIAEGSAQDVAPDPSESIDADFDSHGEVVPSKKTPLLRAARWR